MVEWQEQTGRIQGLSLPGQVQRCRSVSLNFVPGKITRFSALERKLKAFFGLRRTSDHKWHVYESVPRYQRRKQFLWLPDLDLFDPFDNFLVQRVVNVRQDGCSRELRSIRGDAISLSGMRQGDFFYRLDSATINYTAGFTCSLGKSSAIISRKSSFASFILPSNDQNVKIQFDFRSAHPAADLLQLPLLLDGVILLELKDYQLIMSLIIGQSRKWSVGLSCEVGVSYTWILHCAKIVWRP